VNNVKVFWREKVCAFEGDEEKKSKTNSSRQEKSRKIIQEFWRKKVCSLKRDQEKTQKIN